MFAAGIDRATKHANTRGPPLHVADVLSVSACTCNRVNRRGNARTTACGASRSSHAEPASAGRSTPTEFTRPPLREFSRADKCSSRKSKMVSHAGSARADRQLDTSGCRNGWADDGRPRSSRICPEGAAFSRTRAALGDYTLPRIRSHTRSTRPGKMRETLCTLLSRLHTHRDFR